MNAENIPQELSRLDALCRQVRESVSQGATDLCYEPVCRAMEQFPHAPQPHNLLGILLEKDGDHGAAMKHFRAAWALDPGYEPARHNLQTYGTFFSGGRCAFDESDLPAPGESRMQIEYDSRGIGQAVYKTKIEYDRHGIGRVVRR